MSCLGHIQLQYCLFFTEIFLENYTIQQQSSKIFFQVETGAKTVFLVFLFLKE